MTVTVAAATRWADVRLWHIESANRHWSGGDLSDVDHFCMRDPAGAAATTTLLCVWQCISLLHCAAESPTVGNNMWGQERALQPVNQTSSPSPSTNETFSPSPQHYHKPLEESQGTFHLSGIARHRGGTEVLAL